MTRGSCLCGVVTWEANAPFQLMSHCHCSMCRKSHGTAFGTYVATESQGFRWTSGEAEISHYESSPGFDRPFCSHCGSVVAGEPHDGLRFMPAGNLLDDPDVRPLAHIFAASRAPWFTIEDELRSFDAYPPGEKPEIVRRVEPASQPGRARGGCLCGKVSFELDTGSHPIIFCHCSRCRRGRSAAHACNLFAEAEKFHWLKGEEEIEVFAVPDAARFTNRFCRSCGSIAPRLDRDLGRAMVPAGSLDHDPVARPVMHIFTADKANWYEIPGSLPQLPQGPE
jgi:hypothetical protein